MGTPPRAARGRRRQRRGRRRRGHFGQRQGKEEDDHSPIAVGFRDDVKVVAVVRHDVLSLRLPL